MIIFWAKNDLEGLPLYTIINNPTTDWYDTESGEFYSSYLEDKFIINEERNNEYVLQKFIDFLYMIYTEFDYCSNEYTYSNITKTDVELVVKNIIDNDPDLFLRITNAVVIAPGRRFSSYGIKYKHDLEELVTSITDSYIKKYYPNDYKIFNMEMKLKKGDH